MKIKVNQLSTPTSQLGEGIYLDNINRKLYWVDIINGSIYHYNIDMDILESSYNVSNNPSCILSVLDEKIIYLDNFGVKEMNISSGVITLLKEHSKHCSLSHRANDGVLLSNNSIIYGTMNYNPSIDNGNICILNENNELSTYSMKVNIPNTFIELDDGVLISDSFEKKIYKYNYLKKNKCQLTLWKDFSNEEYTPDGGCLSERGYIHIALWDGAAVLVLDRNGEEVNKIKLPVLRPTNCVIYKNRWLYITSAYDDMTIKQRELYPLSGKTLVVDLGEYYEF